MTRYCSYCRLDIDEAQEEFKGVTIESTGRWYCSTCAVEVVDRWYWGRDPQVGKPRRCFRCKRKHTVASPEHHAGVNVCVDCWLCGACVPTCLREWWQRISPPCLDVAAQANDLRQRIRAFEDDDGA